MYTGQYEHKINVNIGGPAKRPHVTLWCMDCVTTIKVFDQINPWAALEEAVAKHCSEPSQREKLLDS